MVGKRKKEIKTERKKRKKTSDSFFCCCGFIIIFWCCCWFLFSFLVFIFVSHWFHFLIDGDRGGGETVETERVTERGWELIFLVQCYNWFSGWLLLLLQTNNRLKRFLYWKKQRQMQRERDKLFIYGADVIRFAYLRDRDNLNIEWSSE